MICSFCLKGLEQTFFFMNRMAKAESTYFQKRRLEEFERTCLNESNLEESIIDTLKIETSEELPIKIINQSKHASSSSTSKDISKFKVPSIPKSYCDEPKNLTAPELPRRISFNQSAIYASQNQEVRNSKRFSQQEKSLLNAGFMDGSVIDDSYLSQVSLESRTINKGFMNSNLSMNSLTDSTSYDNLFKPSPTADESCDFTINVSQVTNVRHETTYAASNTVCYNSEYFDNSANYSTTQNSTNWHINRKLMEDADASSIISFTDQNKTKPEDEYLFLALNASSSSSVTSKRRSSACSEFKVTRPSKGEAGIAPETLFNCKTCLKSFSNLIDYQEHIEKVHESSKKLSCSFCPRKFCLEKNLAAHIQQHENPSKVSEIFEADTNESQHRSINRHREISLRRKSFSCKCGKSFNYNFSLVKHQQICEE